MDNVAHCEKLVREADRDRYLATLFAPLRHRGGLFALHAFDIELARVREKVSGPLPGEIRLQWWSEVLSGLRAEEARSNPVAGALMATVSGYRLPPALLDNVVAARRFDIYDEPMASLSAFESYAMDTAGALLACAIRILMDGHETHVAPLVRPLAVAATLAQHLVNLPADVAASRFFLPVDVAERHGVGDEDMVRGGDHAKLRAAAGELRMLAQQRLAEAGSHLDLLPAAALPALMPHALAGARLRRFARAGDDPYAFIDSPAWRRQWLLWRASRRPERMFR